MVWIPIEGVAEAHRVKLGELAGEFGLVAGEFGVTPF